MSSDADNAGPGKLDASDHDLLIRIDERVMKLDTCMANHLRHHWVVTAAALTAMLSAIGVAIVGFVWR